MGQHCLERIVSPRSIVIFGVNDNVMTMGSTQLLNIITSGYKGDIYPVHPRLDTVLGLKAYKSLAEIPDHVQIDLAFIVIPSEAALAVLEQCGKRGITSAVLITAGFNGLKLVFRDDYISVDCAFDRINNVETFASRLRYRNTQDDYYVVLAMDGETFGHHVKHAFHAFLNPLFDSLPRRNDIKLCTVSEIVDTFPVGAVQVPRDSSWSTMPYDLAADIPFPLWFNPHNDLHVQQYRFMMFAVVLVNLAGKYRESMDDERRGMYDNARNFLDRGLHSCQSWWASKRPWYSPDMILRGLGEILLSTINAKRSIPDMAPEIKEAAGLIIADMLKAHEKIVLSL